MPQSKRMPRDRGRSRAVLPTDREVLLARMCLHLAARCAGGDQDQEFIDTYDLVKALAEPTLRSADGNS